MGDIGNQGDMANLRRADVRALTLIAAMTGVSFIIASLSAYADLRRLAPESSWRHPFLNEGSSHLAILMLAALIPVVVDRARIDTTIRRIHAASLHLAGFAVFSIGHVAIMYGLRISLFPTLVGYEYDLNLFEPANLLYEMRKDAFTYALLTLGIYGFRGMERRNVVAEAAADQARSTGLITLRSGGASFVTASNDIICASAAGNYVDVATAAGDFLARMTFARLVQLLGEAGGDHIRVHRSHIISLSRIVEVAPNGEGGLEVKLTSGRILPCSRRYRDALLSALPRGVAAAASADRARDDADARSSSD